MFKGKVSNIGNVSDDGTHLVCFIMFFAKTYFPFLRERGVVILSSLAAQ